jgi:hypothetical protein
MIAPRILVALLAACVASPRLATRVPLHACPPGLPRALLIALRAGAVTMTTDGKRAATVDPDALEAALVASGDSADDVAPAQVAQLAAWCLSAPAALVRAGRNLLARRVRRPATRPAPVESLGAHELWRLELTAGRRTIGAEDALARAARWEAAALDALRDGDTVTAARMIDRAAAELTHAPTGRDA